VVGTSNAPTEQVSGELSFPVATLRLRMKAKISGAGRAVGEGMIEIVRRQTDGFKVRSFKESLVEESGVSWLPRKSLAEVETLDSIQSCSVLVDHGVKGLVSCVVLVKSTRLSICQTAHFDGEMRRWRWSVRAKDNSSVQAS
jgi:hypothetical protein